MEKIFSVCIATVEIGPIHMSEPKLLLNSCIAGQAALAIGCKKHAASRRQAICHCDAENFET